MELKNYQIKVLDELNDYLTELAAERDKYIELREDANETVRDLAKDYDFPQKAWKQTGKAGYFSQKDGLGLPLPDVYLKVPTGGGKTLLACHAIGRINRVYLKRQAGAVLWIVPTEQIYRQTLKQLRDRAHPYRQWLDVTSGGRTVIKERRQTLTPAETDQSLVVLLLMLPAANRQTKESLRMFRDSGGYDGFFPHEGDYGAHRALIEAMPNLDTFPANEALGQTELVKTSLGNTLRLLRPLIVLDEGQKAYSELARKTVLNFNPAFILELSATPPSESNVVTSVSGKDLDEEGMIKLDIHLENRPTPDWEQVVFNAVNKLEQLRKVAEEHRQNHNRYIRPIALIQVERTGRDQRDGVRIHAEDARECLITKCQVPPHQIAVKSSDKNELGDIDLLAEGCEIRYIITKSALQEGWDCSFAYVLAVLSNLSAKMALTQLVGRILRQPDARKTGVAALDECYVFTNRADSGNVVKNIQDELANEGLEDLVGRIASDGVASAPSKHVSEVVPKFKKFKGRLYLPQFIVDSADERRPLDYHGDILANLDWEKADITQRLDEIVLSEYVETGRVANIGLEGAVTYNAVATGNGLDVDPVLMTRQLLDTVPNPWLAYMHAVRILDYLERKHGATKLAHNFTNVIELAKRYLAQARDEMAERFFRDKIGTGEFKLAIITGIAACKIPQRITVYGETRFNRYDGTPLQRSLFDFIPKADVNGYEEEVGLFLDEHEKLLWWYRNPSGRDSYKLQGWKRGRVQPDFIFRKTDDKPPEMVVIETKGEHLKGNEDTDYKRALLDLCNTAEITELSLPSDMLGDDSSDSFRFEMVDKERWRNVLTELLG